LNQAFGSEAPEFDRLGKGSFEQREYELPWLRKWSHKRGRREGREQMGRYGDGK
jgi:hypothetical protein